MRYKGEIKDFHKFVISDPQFSKDVRCRYEKDLNTNEDWIVQLLIKEVDEPVKEDEIEYNEKGLDFSILIKRKNSISNLLDIGQYTYEIGAKLKKTIIGTDSAQICIGVNEKAEEISDFAKRFNDSKNVKSKNFEHHSSFAIHTLGDGKFGTVAECSKRGTTDFILIEGYFEEGSEVETIDELKDYLVKQLNIENLELCNDIIEFDKDFIEYEGFY